MIGTNRLQFPYPDQIFEQSTIAMVVATCSLARSLFEFGVCVATRRTSGFDRLPSWPYFHPGEKSDEISYMKERRRTSVVRCQDVSIGQSRWSCGCDAYAELKQDRASNSRHHHGDRSTVQRSDQG